MHTVHNARINLLATALNNVALAFIVAGFVAPAVTEQLPTGGRALVTVAWIGLGVGIHLCAATGAREPAPTVTWDQVVIWLIVPATVAIVIGGGGVWLSRRNP